METMFDTLLQLPLFQGLAQEDFTCILEKVKLHFTKHKPGELLLQKDSSCHELVFILKGEVASSTLYVDASYSFTHRANTEVHTVSISKAFVMKELFSYEIFRLNYMNMVSNRAQMLHNRLWKVAGNDLEARISHFILSHVERPSGKKVLKIKMEDLAQIVNETRAGISKALNNMQDRELIELHRGEIVIPDAENLILA